MKLMDCHNHSQYSFDADFSVKEMCDSAQENGLSVFAITDHCDVNDSHLPNLEDDISKSIADITTLKQSYGNMKLIAGIELGQPLQDTARVSRLLKLEGLDFVIGSLHNVKDELDFCFIDYTSMSQEELEILLHKYYQELYEMVTSCDFDVLGHLTYPFRYLYKAKTINNAISTDDTFLDEMIYEVLKKLVQIGKGLEINTSGLFQEIAQTMPSEKHLKMYYQLGGKILSIGSDAHCPQNVGAGISQGIELASAIGFQHLTYFEKRHPVMVRI